MVTVCTTDCGAFLSLAALPLLSDVELDEVEVVEVDAAGVDAAVPPVLDELLLLVALPLELELVDEPPVAAGVSVPLALAGVLPPEALLLAVPLPFAVLPLAGVLLASATVGAAVAGCGASGA